MSLPEAVPERPLSMARERFERIYRTIRDRICLLEYQPGERLGEEELARLVTRDAMVGVAKVRPAAQEARP